MKKIKKVVEQDDDDDCSSAEEYIDNIQKTPVGKRVKIQMITII